MMICDSGLHFWVTLYKQLAAQEHIVLQFCGFKVLVIEIICSSCWYRFMVNPITNDDVDVVW